MTKCLNALITQDYPHHNYEIIIVDDQSTDHTLERLKSLKTRQTIILQNPRREKYHSSKKAALEWGILKARGPILLFTDADCQPPPSWIKTMVSFFDASTGLVAGFSPQTARNALLNRLLNIDAGAAAVVSAASIGWGRGITCTGRNLAYRKKAFDDIGGFNATPDSLSGDDDFMLQAISRHPGWKIKYALDVDARVPAQGPDTVNRFLQQKNRHISAGKHYPFVAKVLFAVYHISNLLLWLSLLAAFFSFYFLLFFFVKFFVDFFILRFFLGHFSEKINKGFLVWELLFLYYNVIAGPFSFIKQRIW